MLQLLKAFHSVPWPAHTCWAVLANIGPMLDNVGPLVDQHGCAG